ncbi:Os01g0806600, partial [Oryza sativa Japonica Group]
FDPTIGRLSGKAMPYPKFFSLLGSLQRTVSPHAKTYMQRRLLRPQFAQSAARQLKQQATSFSTVLLPLLFFHIDPGIDDIEQLHALQPPPVIPTKHFRPFFLLCLWGL